MIREKWELGIRNLELGIEDWELGEIASLCKLISTYLISKTEPLSTDSHPKILVNCMR